MVAPGEWITASGEWVNDRTHGQQFKARFIRTDAPSSVEGIEKYLGSGMIRGIGPVYARKLVRAFGEKVFDVIEAEPERLREVTGIGRVRAKRITDAWAEQKVVREIMVFLHSHGVGTARAVRIFRTDGAGARSLNIELQAALNPAGERKVERFGWTLAPGDKVMQIENDYDKEVYNGDIGLVADVDPEAGELTARFEGRDLVYGFGELDTLVPAYAATVHKSQGLGVSGRGDPSADPALRDAAAEPPLHRGHARQAAGCAGGPEEGGRHCGAQHLGAPALVEAGRVAGRSDGRCGIRFPRRRLVATGIVVDRSAAFGFGAGFSRASIAVASREMCSTRWPSIVRAINVSCRRFARRLSANSEKARENVASLGSRPAPLQPHSRHSLPSTSRRSISARVVGTSNTALAMKARASAARSSSGRPTWPRK